MQALGANEIMKREIKLLLGVMLWAIIFFLAFVIVIPIINLIFKISALQIFSFIVIAITFFIILYLRPVYRSFKGQAKSKNELKKELLLKGGFLLILLLIANTILVLQYRRLIEAELQSACSSHQKTFLDDHVYTIEICEGGSYPMTTGWPVRLIIKNDKNQLLLKRNFVNISTVDRYSEHSQVIYDFEDRLEYYDLSDGVNTIYFPPSLWNRFQAILPSVFLSYGQLEQLWTP